MYIAHRKRMQRQIYSSHKHKERTTIGKGGERVIQLTHTKTGFNFFFFVFSWWVFDEQLDAFGISRGCCLLHIVSDSNYSIYEILSKIGYDSICYRCLRNQIELKCTHHSGLHGYLNAKKYPLALHTCDVFPVNRIYVFVLHQQRQMQQKHQVECGLTV